MASHPEMTAGISLEQPFPRLYLEPLLQMKDAQGNYVRWTDLRLIRRMLRDAVHRAYDPTRTLEHWHYVRSSELRSIIPYINTTDYIVNTRMPYELALYRPRLLAQFAEWEQKYHKDPLRQDAYTRAGRLHRLLQASRRWRATRTCRPIRCCVNSLAVASTPLEPGL